MPDRAANMLFSDPYLNAGQIVTVQIDNTTINSKDDLSGKTVGAQIGTTGAIEVEAIAGATLTTFDTVDLAYLALQNGQIDAVVADSPTAAGFVAQNADKLKMVGSVFTDENYGIASLQDEHRIAGKDQRRVWLPSRPTAHLMHC